MDNEISDQNYFVVVNVHDRENANVIYTDSAILKINPKTNMNHDIGAFFCKDPRTEIKIVSIAKI